MPTTAFWDAAAESFDDEADHGLRDPRVRAAWATRLTAWLPEPPKDILDIGCGTGSLTLLMAQMGHRVTGADLSPRMIDVARRKVAGLDVRLLVADAASLPLDHPVDVIVVRHLLWTMPDPVAALRHWIGLCRPGGRLVLVEGRWGTGGDETYGADLPWTGGVTAETLTATLRPLVAALRVEPLTGPDLWGRVISDERYCVLADY